MKRSKWEQRIQRADELAAAHPFAAEVLQFYKHITGFQKALYSYIEKASGNGSAKTTSGLLHEHLNLSLLIPKFSEFLSNVEKVAPQPIAQSARDLNAQGASRWQHLLASHWQSAADFHSRPSRSLVGMDFSATAGRIPG